MKKAHVNVDTIGHIDHGKLALYIDRRLSARMDPSDGVQEAQAVGDRKLDADVRQRRRSPHNS
jgi:translation elongation factor EF-Tu-like GTPase